VDITASNESIKLLLKREPPAHGCARRVTAARRPWRANSAAKFSVWRKFRANRRLRARERAPPQATSARRAQSPSSPTRWLRDLRGARLRRRGNGPTTQAAATPPSRRQTRPGAIAPSPEMPPRALDESYDRFTGRLASVCFSRPRAMAAARSILALGDRGAMPRRGLHARRGPGSSWLRTASASRSTRGAHGGELERAAEGCLRQRAASIAFTTPSSSPPALGRGRRAPWRSWARGQPSRRESARSPRGRAPPCATRRRRALKARPAPRRKALGRRSGPKTSSSLRWAGRAASRGGRSSRPSRRPARGRPRNPS